MKDFKKSIVWQKAIDLTIQVYALTKEFPKSEMYGLISQSTRAAVSISANIAEGCGRDGQADKKKFLGYSLGSSFELETELILAQKLNYVHTEQATPLMNLNNEIQKMLISLQAKV